MDIRRTEGSFALAGDRGLFRRAWLPREPERVFVVAHGFAEHSGRYEALGTWFAERGCAVHAYDLRGHGRSDGPRNYVNSFADYQEDLSTVLELVRGEHPGLELVLVGHSMGGLVCAGLVCEHAPELLGVVLSGPALMLRDALSGPRLWLAKLMRRVAPHILVDAGLPVEGLSRDPEVCRLYEQDPWVDTRMTPSLAIAMGEAMQRIAAGGCRVEVPVLLLHGGDDPVCSPAGSEAFFESLPRGLAPPSALKVYPGLLHEIFNEPEKESVLGDVLDWVRCLEASPMRPAVGIGA